MGKIIDPHIGIRTLSDHTPVHARWVIGSTAPRQCQWRLNNFPLETPAIVGFVDKEVKNSFVDNTRSALSIVV